MDSIGVRLARALLNAQAGSFLATPPGFDGSPGLETMWADRADVLRIDRRG